MEEKSSAALASDVECRTPAGIAAKIADSVMPAKADSKLKKLIILGILAGVYISFGAEIATVVGHDAKEFLGFGVAKLLMGTVFSVGLMLVVLAGGELFTSNILIFISFLRKKATIQNLLRNWTVVYFSNFIGALLLVGLIFGSGLWKQNHDLIGAFALKTAAMKVNLTFLEAFTRGILCNWIVCLAFWMSMASKKTIGKIFAIFFPITIFVASGFEHSIANMFYIPKGILLKHVPEVVAQSGLSATELANLNLHGFVVNNLIPVTLGNIIGAVVFVALFYWLVYLREENN